MTRALLPLALVLCIGVWIGVWATPSSAATGHRDPGAGAAGIGQPAGVLVSAADEAPVALDRCGPRCRAQRQAIRRHYGRPHYRPYRPRPHYHYHERDRGGRAAAVIVGGVIGLGIGAAIANSQPRYHGEDDAPRFPEPGR